VRLHPFDDFPFHQHPAPFDRAATSDPHFNDGYWFAFYSEEWYFVSGLRIHPNVNAMDGFACVAHDGRQHCLRFSRALRPTYDDLAVGPLRLEVLGPMQRVRVLVDDNPLGIRAEVIFDSQAPPFLEDRYQHLKYGVLVNDVLRYTQVCRVTGTAAWGEEVLDVQRWHGMRDHSWGIRSSMGPSTRFSGVDRTSEEMDRRAFRLWVPFEVGDHCGFFHTHEDQSGETLDFEGRLHYWNGSTVGLRSVDHALVYEPGRRRPIGGSFDLLGEDGLTRRYELQASKCPADVQGLGYYGGWHDGGSAGVYRGAEASEQDVYETDSRDDPTGPPHVPAKRRIGPTEYPCVLAEVGGGEGMAHFEHHVFGPYAPYSFG